MERGGKGGDKGVSPFHFCLMLPVKDSGGAADRQRAPLLAFHPGRLRLSYELPLYCTKRPRSLRCWKRGCEIWLNRAALAASTWVRAWAHCACTGTRVHGDACARATCEAPAVQTGSCGRSSRGLRLKGGRGCKRSKGQRVQGREETIRTCRGACTLRLP